MSPYKRKKEHLTYDEFTNQPVLTQTSVGSGYPVQLPGPINVEEQVKGPAEFALRIGLPVAQGLALPILDPALGGPTSALGDWLAETFLGSEITPEEKGLGAAVSALQGGEFAKFGLFGLGKFADEAGDVGKGKPTWKSHLEKESGGAEDPLDVLYGGGQYHKAFEDLEEHAAQQAPKYEAKTPELVNPVTPTTYQGPIYTQTVGKDYSPKQLADRLQELMASGVRLDQLLGEEQFLHTKGKRFNPDSILDTEDSYWDLLKVEEQQIRNLDQAVHEQIIPELNVAAPSGKAGIPSFDVTKPTKTRIVEPIKQRVEGFGDKSPAEVVDELVTSAETQHEQFQDQLGSAYEILDKGYGGQTIKPHRIDRTLRAGKKITERPLYQGEFPTYTKAAGNVFDEIKKHKKGLTRGQLKDIRSYVGELLGKKPGFEGGVSGTERRLLGKLYGSLTRTTGELAEKVTKGTPEYEALLAKTKPLDEAYRTFKTAYNPKTSPVAKFLQQRGLEIGGKSGNRVDQSVSPLLKQINSPEDLENLALITGKPAEAIKQELNAAIFNEYIKPLSGRFRSDVPTGVAGTKEYYGAGDVSQEMLNLPGLNNFYDKHQKHLKILFGDDYHVNREFIQDLNKVQNYGELIEKSIISKDEPLQALGERVPIYDFTKATRMIVDDPRYANMPDEAKQAFGRLAQVSEVINRRGQAPKVATDVLQALSKDAGLFQFIGDVGGLQYGAKARYLMRALRKLGYDIGSVNPEGHKLTLTVEDILRDPKLSKELLNE